MFFGPFLPPVRSAPEQHFEREMLQSLFTSRLSMNNKFKNLLMNTEKKKKKEKRGNGYSAVVVLNVSNRQDER